MKNLLPIIAVCGWLFAVTAQAAEPVVSIRTLAPVQSLAPGKTVILNIELNIAHAYHINSYRPLQDYLIPTTLELLPPPGVTLGKPVFPDALVKKLPFSDSPMAVYEGVIKIAVEVTPAANSGSKEIAINGKVRYQACNDSFCLPPVSLPFGANLPIATASVPGGSSKILDAAESTQPSPVDSKASERAKSTDIDFSNKSVLAIFLLVFLGGLALNLTPCVYPMIPITITYFGGQAEGKKGSLFVHTSLYVIGMGVTYSILGVVAAMTGGLFGAALQYRPVLVGIALIMILLALSMFDVYELRMPQFLNRLAGASHKGFGGTFLMGLTVGIVAAPCIGPFVLGLLTYVGNRGNVLLGFALFFVLALGLGIPFLILGIFSGCIRRLPRSGAWMIWVRKVFGFILLLMAVYFVRNLAPNPLFYYLALSIIMIVAGIYLAWIASVPGSGKLFIVMRNIIGIIFLGAAVFTTVTAMHANVGKPQAHTGSRAASIQWLPYSELMLKRASLESKPVFIDFWADWCVPCKELDIRTFTAPEIIERSKEFIMLKIDLTSADNPESEFLRKKYQARGVPTLVFLSPDGREISELRGTGFEPKEVFLKKMDQALRISGKTGIAAGIPKS
jgi:thioredoxin:protein disulfide reductase